MFLPELEILINDGRIKSVAFIRPSGYTDWEIHFTWSNMTASREPFLQVRSTGERKVYTSLDRALDTLRRLGYMGNIEIQG